MAAHSVESLHALRKLIAEPPALMQKRLQPQIDAHCLTIVTFGGTSITEKNLDSINVFVNNLLDGSGPVMRAYETNRSHNRILLSDILADLLAKILPI